MAALLKQLEDRRKQYWIIDAKMNRIPGQTQLFQDIIDRLNLPIAERFRFYLYYGGNGAWKSFVGGISYCSDGTRVWRQKYWLPFIGAKKEYMDCY